MLALHLEHDCSLPEKLFEVGKLDRKLPWAEAASVRAGRFLTPLVSSRRPWKYTIQFRNFLVLISDNTRVDDAVIVFEHVHEGQVPQAELPISRSISVPIGEWYHPPL